MERRNTWILGCAILLGFSIFGLSQLWAQRFPGDGRGGSEGLVGRYQVVRSSPEAVLLLDTATGELYSAGREDIRPTSARPRGGEVAGPGNRFKDKGDFKESIPEPRFTDKAKADFKRDEIKDKEIHRFGGDAKKE
jgi:hypothetical protein